MCGTILIQNPVYLVVIGVEDLGQSCQFHLLVHLLTMLYFVYVSCIVDYIINLMN